MSNDSLGDRMKSYEDCYRTTLPIRMPVIIRVDGKAFHTYTAKCKRPVDEKLVKCMNNTAIKLCQTIQGCQLAYVQSDEISLLLTNYQEIDTQSWFDNNLLKMVSVSAAVASATFSLDSWRIFAPANSHELDAWMKPAYFDSRAFVIPKEDVVNYFIWRQQDATRNSVQMLARSLYSHKELIGKNNSDLQELCFQKGHNWNDCPVPQKRGRCIVKEQKVKTGQNKKTGETIESIRSEWVVDENIPIFSSCREYVTRFVFPDVKYPPPGKVYHVNYGTPGINVVPDSTEAYCVRDIDNDY